MQPTGSISPVGGPVARRHEPARCDPAARGPAQVKDQFGSSTTFE